MKTLNLTLSLILIAFLGISTTIAQGEAVFASNNSDNGFNDEEIAKKDVQPYTLKVDPLVNSKYVITRIKEEKSYSGINLFPNPVSDMLHLNLQRAKDIDLSAMHYVLQNEDGKEMAANKISEVVENIDLTDLEKSQYTLSVFSGDVLVKSYRVKIQ